MKEEGDGRTDDNITEFAPKGERERESERIRKEGSRHEILRGIFHRINRVLFRKSQIFDLDTIFYLTYYVKKKFKKPDLLDLWKNPLTIPCLHAIDQCRDAECAAEPQS